MKRISKIGAVFCVGVIGLALTPTFAVFMQHLVVGSASIVTTTITDAIFALAIYGSLISLLLALITTMLVTKNSVWGDHRLLGPLVVIAFYLIALLATRGVFRFLYSLAQGSGSLVKAEIRYSTSYVTIFVSAPLLAAIAIAAFLLFRSRESE